MNASDDAPAEAGNRPDEVRPAGSDPTDTDHPTGEEQAAENAATESPG
jgi:hypothetical protein